LLLYDFTYTGKNTEHVLALVDECGSVVLYNTNLAGEQAYITGNSALSVLEAFYRHQYYRIFCLCCKNWPPELYICLSNVKLLVEFQ
jgi:hypothetical protein